MISDDETKSDSSSRTLVTRYEPYHTPRINNVRLMSKQVAYNVNTAPIDAQRMDGHSSICSAKYLYNSQDQQIKTSVAARKGQKEEGEI